MKKVCLTKYLKSQESTVNNDKRLQKESSHLCVLYVTTAGLRYPNQAFVEEIVLLVYTLINIQQNKVVGVKQYMVNPQLPAIRKRFLSEKIMQDAGLRESYIKNCVSLGTAIQQFEQYWESTFSSGSSNHSLCFVTDGQLTLRQHMYTEALSKNLQLPQHYAYFHDLRKEFLAYSGLPNMTLTVGNMLSYLGIPPCTGSQFYLKEIGDIVNIIQKMLATGHMFTNLERINLHLVPRVYKKSDTVEDNCIVKVSGIPGNCNDLDVAKFFIGLDLAEGGVALCLNSQGQRNGKALVRFANCEHRELALSRHKYCFKNSYIELQKASGEDFINVAGGSNSEVNAFLSKGAEAILKMRGLPYNCTAKQVLDFFEAGENSCEVMHGEEGVLFAKRPKLKTPFVAFVLFAREEGACKALSKHGEIIDSKSIDISRITIAEVQQLLNRSVYHETNEVHQMVSTQVLPEQALMTEQIITSGAQKDCILLRGLPRQAEVKHVATFLREYIPDILFQGIHIIHNERRVPTGDAFVRMNSEQTAFLSAQRRHLQNISFRKRSWTIRVYQCSGQELKQYFKRITTTEAAAYSNTQVNTVLPQATISAPLAPALIVQSNTTATITNLGTITDISSAKAIPPTRAASDPNTQANIKLPQARVSSPLAHAWSAQSDTIAAITNLGTITDIPNAQAIPHTRTVSDSNTQTNTMLPQATVSAPLAPALPVQSNTTAAITSPITKSAITITDISSAKVIPPTRPASDPNTQANTMLPQATVSSPLPHAWSVQSNTTAPITNLGTITGISSAQGITATGTASYPNPHANTVMPQATVSAPLISAWPIQSNTIATITSLGINSDISNAQAIPPTRGASDSNTQTNTMLPQATVSAPLAPAWSMQSNNIATITSLGMMNDISSAQAIAPTAAALYRNTYASTVLPQTAVSAPLIPSCPIQSNTTATVANLGTTTGISSAQAMIPKGGPNTQANTMLPQDTISAPLISAWPAQLNTTGTITVLGTITDISSAQAIAATGTASYPNTQANIVLPQTAVSAPLLPAYPIQSNTNVTITGLGTMSTQTITPTGVANTMLPQPTVVAPLLPACPVQPNTTATITSLGTVTTQASYQNTQSHIILPQVTVSAPLISAWSVHDYRSCYHH